MKNSVKERVRIRIGSMGGDEFERFISELLPKIYKDFETLEPSFNLTGKTTKGKCDAYVYHEKDDTYTAIVCTTIQDNPHEKLLNDISKLTKTRFYKKIRRVLLCINTPIKDEVEDYRAACANHGWHLDPLSLERITTTTLDCEDLLKEYFDEMSSGEKSILALRRFDCGPRVKEAREDLSLCASMMIEKIDFHSEKQWKMIESAELEISERYITALENLSGISPTWLKHGVGAKYPIESIYDYQFEKISWLASKSPLVTYMAIEPNSMSPLLFAKFSDVRWSVFYFGFSMNFGEWIGDENHIPRIFELLTSVRDQLSCVNGRIISKNLFDEFLKGSRHPAGLFAMTGQNNYWFDDLFDIHHRYPIAQSGYRHHGDWFVQLQNTFRRYAI
ncbi:hypothetical protein [Paraburkholderia megapolitana]|uniref:hypothetical protein n=1 Tax=Paraburkholderia megapolitana TaxID=420953 RepID=UPI0038BC7A4E